MNDKKEGNANKETTTSENAETNLENANDKEGAKRREANDSEASKQAKNIGEIIKEIKFIDCSTIFVLIFVFFLVILSFFNLLPLTRESIGIEIPIPVSNFVGGTELLTSGRWVNLSVYVPNKDGTPVPRFETTGEVRSVTITDEKPVAIIIAISENEVETLQSALVNANTKIVFRLIQGKPPTSTSTPTPTDTPEPTPITITVTPSPKENFVYWEIEATKVVSRLELLNKAQPVKLVVLYQPISYLSDIATPIPFTTFDTCSQVEDFLDENRERQGAYRDNTEYILIQIPTSNLPDALKSIYQYEEIYLIPDLTCK